MYKILSLFGNVGIAETHLNQKRFRTVVYNELLSKRAEFYKHFHPKVHQIIGDITNNGIKKEIINESIKKKSVL